MSFMKTHIDKALLVHHNHYSQEDVYWELRKHRNHYSQEDVYWELRKRIGRVYYPTGYSQNILLLMSLGHKTVGDKNSLYGSHILCIIIMIIASILRVCL